MNSKKLVLAFAAMILILLSSGVYAQTTRSFNNIRVDELSDQQIREMIEQMSLGRSDAKLEQAALSKGMKLEEVKKLRTRVERIKRIDREKIQASANDTLNLARDTLAVKDTIPDYKAKIFGSDLFSGTTNTFEPNLRLATPQNYQVGPDDELLIDIYGYSEASYNLKVNPEGTINIPYVGVVSVGGMTIEQATARIRSRLSTIYSGINSGNTNVRIAIGNIRSIKVVLTGEIVKPGTYTLPSVASIFNALYQSGGPSDNGSFRVIELIRGGTKIATVDIYDFLLEGRFKSNVRLQDNDVIRVPTYFKRVEVVGEVKRPGIFEMLDGETLEDLLRFAGDFTGSAYRARIKVLKNTAIERKISDIVAQNFANYQPSNGDKFFVDQILERFENRVTIDGAVFRPGEYELSPGLTLSQLIGKAEGLREDAFQNRGYILRLKDDMQTELVSFNLSAILNGQIADIPLKREDIVSISSIFDLKEGYYINIGGEIREPGRLAFAEGMTLEDAILQAGGLKEGATPQRVEISRRIKNSDVLSKSAQTAEVFQVNISKDLIKDAKGFILQPFDMIVVRPSAGYEVQRLVRIQGEVVYPGIYTISKKDERLSDLIARAGGLTAQAFT
ncbi:MAG: SLBB domain-containing protein, partial [Daejeonella sp.]|uniref:SLBB domain-containing protein n=1 Tax=Daejeonella sp. TaxID=2805397 RepID=UPI003C77F3FE